VYKHIALIDKPSGITSMECVEVVKRYFKAKKAGHSGTLDPKVTGLMLVALDEAVKAIPFLMGLDKEYTGTMHLHKDVEKQKLLDAFKKFTGEIVQIPPVRSAVARKSRKRVIYTLELIEKQGKDVLFKVKCEAGTYIRKLCSDIGEYLGCGAHMKSLRRTAIDGFSVGESYTLDSLNADALIYLEDALERVGIKKIFVKAESIKGIKNGLPVRENDIESITGKLKKGEKVGIFLEKNIIAIGEVVLRNNLIAKTDRVFNI